MVEALTVLAKYIFLDVVDFTYDRSVEAQTDIVAALNGIVKASVGTYRITDDKVIYLPTGDGICVALLNVDSPYDIQLLIALGIIKGVNEHNIMMKDGMRRFKVRIGLNSNIDNLVTDINGNRNIAGAGINASQRVMSLADGNQILLSESVFETLRYREKYMKGFKFFLANVKHDARMPIYQFVSQGHEGLDIGIPQGVIEKRVPILVRFADRLNYAFAVFWNETFSVSPAPNKSFERTRRLRASHHVSSDDD